MTHATKKLLDSVLELPDDIRFVFFEEIYDSLKKYKPQGKQENDIIETTESKENDGAENNKAEIFLFPELSKIQNDLLSSRHEKIKTSSIAYFSIAQIQKKLNLKLDQLNQN